MDNQATSLTKPQSNPKKLIESWQNWWQLAGVEDIAMDAPYHWCAPDEEPAILAKVTPSTQTHQKARPEQSVTANGQTPHTHPTPIASARAEQPSTQMAENLAANLEELKETLPNNLPDFQKWWRSEFSISDLGGLGDVIPPDGDGSEDIMAVMAMPEANDKKRLCEGELGALLENMLRAIGYNRTKTYCAAILPQYCVDHSMVIPRQAEIFAIFHHHLSLVRPKKLIVFGALPNMALTGNASPQNGHHKANINHITGQYHAIYSLPLTNLLKRPQLKAQSWRGLQQLLAD